MRHRKRILLLAGLAILLLLLTSRESYHLFSELRHLDLPRQETREPLGRSGHGWMNAEELAEFYKVPVGTVFSALEIDSAPGDEKMPLKELAEKYDKSPADIESALKILNDQVPSRGTNRHG